MKMDKNQNSQTHADVMPAREHPRLQLPKCCVSTSFPLWPVHMPCIPVRPVQMLLYSFAKKHLTAVASVPGRFIPKSAPQRSCGRVQVSADLLVRSPMLMYHVVKYRDLLRSQGLLDFHATLRGLSLLPRTTLNARLACRVVFCKYSREKR